MAVSEPSGLARVALMHLERATRFGVPRAELLREVRLTEEQLRDPDARVPRSALVRLWRAVAARAPDSGFGLRYGANFRLREFGLVGYAMAFSGTVGAALERLARYDRILSETLAVTPDPEAEATTVPADVGDARPSFRP